MSQETAPQWGPGRYAADRELGLAASVRSGATPIGDRTPGPQLIPKTFRLWTGLIQADRRA